MRSATRVGWAHKEMEKSKQAKKLTGLICLLVFKSINVSLSHFLPSECTTNLMLSGAIVAAGPFCGTAVLWCYRFSVFN
jgi:hypothetical protein